MIATLLIAIALVATVSVAAVLSDCGLRWWSAFVSLRRQLKMAKSAAIPALRPPLTVGGTAGFDRSNANRAAIAAFSRAA